MKVGIIMGSKSDLETMTKAAQVLDDFSIPYEMVIASAHRTPGVVKAYVERLTAEGAIAFIAGAGAAAHLPGVVLLSEFPSMQLASTVWMPFWP